MQHRSRISALVHLLLAAALIAAACSTSSSPQSDPAPTVVDVNDSQSPATDDPAPATTAEPSTGPDTPTPTDGTATDEPPADDPPAQDAADPTEPQPDEPEPEPDPWASRRSDLLIELTDPVDVDLRREFGGTVGERRGLELLEEVPVYLIRRADLGTYFDSLYDEDDIEEAEFAEAIYRILRIIDPQLDYHTLLQSLYTGLVLGLYDDDIGAFIIVSDNDHISRRDLDTIAHEFVHALQDQHFDLGASFDSNGGNTDAASAYRFVLEGDARLSENLFKDLIRQFAGDLDATLDRLPGAGGVSPILRRIFDAPYIDGVSAVTSIIAEGGPNAVDPYLLDPPASTEQLLHPDKLAAREPPIEVDAPDLEMALGAGWT